MKSLTILVFLIGMIGYGQRSDFDAITFTKADSIALKYKGASLKNLPVLTYNLTHTLDTDVEKFRSIYTWVCTNIENDYSSFQKTVRKRKKLFKNKEELSAWNDSFTPKVFENLLKYKKTACTGYAYLVRELAHLAGIKCEIVNGYGRTPTLVLNENSIPNHSWNAVELNGKWYLCDPTWSAGRIILENEGPRFISDYFDSYFLADPQLFVKNHYPLEIASSLLLEPPTLNQFIEGPVVYKEAFSIGVTPSRPKQMHLEVTKNEPLTFDLNAASKISKNNIQLMLSSGLSTKEVRPNVLQNKQEYQLRYTFEKPGRYDVHIKVNDIIIATYTVKVKRN